MLDLFPLFESQLDSTFPINLFKINVHGIFTYHLNRFEVSLVIYIDKQAPCKLLSEHSRFFKLEILILEFDQNSLK